MRVMERIPIPVYLADRYCVVRIVETLECGHKQDAFAYSDPLTAKYRICRACARRVGVSISGRCSMFELLESPDVSGTLRFHLQGAKTQLFPKMAKAA
jgi:hypothetical protein